MTRKPKYRGPSGRHLLVAVDLGKHKLGVAVGLTGGVEAPLILQAATLQHPLGGGASPDAVADMVLEWVQEASSAFADLRLVWVCEWPEKYARHRDKHESIESLWAVGQALHRAGVRWRKKYPPKVWKGNVPKVPHHRRLRAALGEEAVERLSPRGGLGHDAWDAIGIFLYATGITKRGGVR